MDGLICIIFLDLEKCGLKEEPKTLISQELGRWDDAGIKGSHVIKKEGIYYLFYSSWTRGYAVGYATAKMCMDPGQNQLRILCLGLL